MKPLLFIPVLYLALNSYAQSAGNIHQTLTARDKVLKPDTLTLFDSGRKRLVPVAVYTDGRDNTGKPVVIFSHGYGQNKGGDYLYYSYLTGALAEKGYFVISIQHELPEDELMNTTGDPKIVRRPFWERGAGNIRFVIDEMKRMHPEPDYKQTTLIGHSNGGDMVALFPQKYPGYVSTIITLDNRRMDLPRMQGLQVYTLRSADQPADEGVLPTEDEKKKYGIVVVNLPDINHNDMDDDAGDRQRKEIVGYLLNFLGKSNR